MTDELATRRRPHDFQPGVSGNPRGRPRGSKNARTLFLEGLLEGQAEALIQKTIALALEGDTVALRLCMERLLPPRKDRPIEVELPELRTAADAVGVSAALFQAVAAGEITPAEASEVSKLLEAFTRAVETRDLETRLTKLEAAA